MLVKMSYGYRVRLAPIQMITFYNAIANGGKMISPVLIRELRRGDRVEERFETQTIASSICSRAALREVQRCLELVCTQGTASLYFKDSTRLRVAAKTGTAQITDARSREGRYYLGSMVAYFPADNPRYTVLTTIETRAQPGKAYYGGPLAGPVVKRMVDYIYNRNRDWYGRVERHGGRCYPGHVKGGDIAQIRRVADKFSPRASFDQRTGWGRARVDSLSNVIITSLPPETGTMPDVRGMGLKDALFVLESRGLKVRFSGAGAVTQQSIPAGARITPGSTVGKTLKDLLKDTPVTALHGDGSTTVAALAYDSRAVTRSDCFFATRGTQSDGHDFIPDAVAKGASAVVCEQLPAETAHGVAYVVVPDAAGALADMAAAFYGHPSRELKLVGITGTNGKTTTATLLYDLVRALGYKAGLVSTVVYKVGERIVEATHTTPDPVRLNAMMREMADEGCEYCFMECSSHAIVQQRTRGLHFAGGIFSNITHDHLDYHKTFAEYIRAKKLFFDSLAKDAFALTNADDKNGRVMVQNTAAGVHTYSLRTMADFRCKIVEMHVDGMLLRIDGQEVWVGLVGRFNAYNLLAVYGAAVLLGLDRAEVLRAMSMLHAVSGRFEFVRAENGTTAIVDYAHTPDALENVIQTIQEIRTPAQQLIVVCGCGGDRDRTKRPEMAQIAVKYADTAIFTSDNPRHESPGAILDEMAAGLDPGARFLRIVDRAEAIRTAAMLSRPGDILLIAGKGHETYQIIGDVKHHFDDKEEVGKAFGTLRN